MGCIYLYYGYVVWHQHIKILLKIPTGKIHQFQQLKCIYRFIVSYIVYRAFKCVSSNRIQFFIFFIENSCDSKRVEMMIVNQNSQDTKHGVWWKLWNRLTCVTSQQELFDIVFVYNSVNWIITHCVCILFSLSFYCRQ